MDAVRIQEKDFSIEAEVDALRTSSKRIGGVATFLGCARDFSEGRDVSAICFEQYAGMAVQAMQALRSEALERFDIIDARIIHRVTTVHAGEQIVLIAVGAEHRGPAFDACRWIIDELKLSVPIWKKETTPNGDSWVTQHP
ncbi:molybdopterin synthase catalytic subunit [Mariprofundus micogutta]|uniref:Molybdopterin synthase catalytic subunit n=1 Tax=Mariprofundus micogutta TaxID=1921010 RepID=A0A1L8CQN9_9PROT|nr:molybdenum cofactor biosynthesis protein MoaE [Mariprofundus micogutta]GAV21139.1 molybdopterin synthase catalytic subunit [Mariprofundus micogutta]